MREIQIFNYSELNKDAKEKAIEVVRNTDIFGQELVWDLNEAFESTLKSLGLDGIEIDFSLSHSQGDGVAFYGYIDNEHLWNWVNDSKLSDDEVKLIALCQLGRANLDINIERNFLSSRYSHPNTMEVSIPFYDGDDLPFDDDRMEELMSGLELKIKEVVQDKSMELERLGYNMINDYYSDENLNDILEESSLEFYEDGTLYR